ncbi:MAG: ParA family protein [Planctomycetes bacterium]|nr:ParA family protein [Planctomycetota bacterium]
MPKAGMHACTPPRGGPTLEDRAVITEAIRGLFLPSRAATEPGAAVTLAVCSQKGGVGKTTTAVHLAAALARFHGQRVLVVDLDPQGHVGRALAEALPGTASTARSPLSAALTRRRGEVLDSVVPTDLAGLDLTPSDPSLAEAELVLSARIGRELILSGALRAARGCYDAIVLDCPPTLGTLTLNALCAADHVLVPCEMAILAVQGAHELCLTLETVQERLHPGLGLLGLLLTRVDSRNAALNRSVEEALGIRFPGKLLQTRIGVSTALGRAQVRGRSVFDHAPRSSAARDYAALAREVLRRIALA